MALRLTPTPQGAAEAPDIPGRVIAFPAHATRLRAALPTSRPAGERGRILLSPPQVTGGEMAAIGDTIGGGWLAPAGPTPARFEAAVAEACGIPHVAAVSSGTAALHLGYRVLGLEAGDGVWTSTYTFVATVAPAAQMGAAITFLDAAPDSWGMDPGILRDALARAARAGRLPRVVVPVDLYGGPCDLDAIVEACDRWGVPVLCDAAESLGATIRGRPAGAAARLAAFSFNGNKIVTAAGGGALASSDPALIARARHLAAQAKEAAPHYQHETTGYAYGLSSVLAAVGLAQVAVLGERVAARRATFARYVAGLGDLPGVSFMPEPDWATSTRWLSVALFDPAAGPDREAVRRALDAAGIESRPTWKPLHLQPAFRGAGYLGGGVAAGLFERGLCLPSGAMTREEAGRVIEVVRAVRG